MSKYQPYPAYKDSGIEWLGQVPEHWNISYLRYIFSFGKGLTITKADLVDTGIPCVNYGEVHSKFGFEVDPQKHQLKCVPEEYLTNFKSALLAKGNLVFADTSEDLEGSGNFTQLTSNIKTFAGYHTIIARNLMGHNDRYLAYLLTSTEFRTQIQLAVKGVKVFSITQAILRSALAWLPTTQEQKAIANFLDQETSKIDTLIEKQQKMIALLKEKRQAVISHAVTKGLNPNAPMKDSGIEWLGEIPEHWEVMQVRYATEIFRGKFTHRPRNDPKLYDGEYPFIQTGDVARANKFIESYKQTLNENGIKVSQKFPKGSLVMAIAANIGDVAILNFDSYAPDSVVSFKPSNHMNLFYLRYFFIGLLDILKSTAIQSTQANLNIERVGELKNGIPSIKEQLFIVDYLDTQTQKINTLIDKSQQAIELLKERKTALISAAVIGKIDVRER